MAPINILTWNLLNLGARDLQRSDACGPMLFNYIARVIAGSGAHIACLQEITYSTRRLTMGLVQTALDRIAGAGVWAHASGDAANSATDGYGYFWKTASIAMQSLSSNSDTSGLYFYLPGNNGELPGRGAGYMVATPAGSANAYLILNYHAPSKSPGNKVALAQMPDVLGYALANPPSPEFDPLLTRPPAGVIICGDFNVDYETYSNLYPSFTAGTNALSTSVNSLTSLTVIKSGTTAKTLAPTADQLNWDEIDDCTVNAYDNFLYAGVTQAQSPVLLDCVSYNLQGAFGNDAQMLMKAGIWQTNTITSPIATFYQSFIVYRYVVSDHMPVLGSFNLP